VLNSEKMTPRFLKIAEKNVESNMSGICNFDGTAFRNKEERSEHIVTFYEELYKNPPDVPLNFENCVENFLGDLVDHPAIADRKLTMEERDGLEADITVDELDAAMDSCNMRSASGTRRFQQQGN
jgi:hypothetical protein